MTVYYLISILFGLHISFWVIYFYRHRQLELKVNYTWSYLVRRGLVEAITSGVVTINSPLRVRHDVYSGYGEIAEGLRDLYRTIGRNLSEPDLMLEIDKRFGDWIVRNICLKFGISAGACLIIAAEVAKNETNNA